MGFSDAIRELIEALRDERFQHAPRGYDKNLLAAGRITPADVIAMLRACRAGEYAVSPHHADPAVDVHVFKPRVARQRWYVKAFFTEEDGQIAVFISVHPSDHQ